MLAGHAAVEQSKRSLECGADPSQHEQAIVEAERQIGVRDARLVHLQKLLTTAELLATRASKTSLEAVQAALVASHRSRRAASLERMLGALKPILVELAALDQAESALCDPQTGSVSDWALQFREEG
jgi:hypothetical protein